MKNAESRRLQETGLGPFGWRRWGPYVSERSWGTVREDYSRDGSAWDYLSHDKARSKAYRWGEDGIAGICDRYQLLVFALALWNEKDPILKERMFGLTPGEANHGEDVKEYYYYLDNTPTHSYMKFLYKYPQREYPYSWLVEENRRRQAQVQSKEFELIDTGLFNDDRYFDIFVEYAKSAPEDIVIRISAFNRGPDRALLHILPHLWFRNTWCWDKHHHRAPRIELGSAGSTFLSMRADDSGANLLRGVPFAYELGPRYLYAQNSVPSVRPAEILFTDNETNMERVYGDGARSRSAYVKDAFHRYVIHGEAVVNPDPFGTKAAIHYIFDVAPHSAAMVGLRLTDREYDCPLNDVESILQARILEADEFYRDLHPPRATPDECLIQRQALSGMLWTKQIYLFDVEKWLNGDDPHNPPASERHFGRNRHWKHLNSMRILSMPDKWEYPWFAAWDLAFHCVSLALVDLEFAKEQLWLLLFEQFQHPNGQIPAYEWNFSDVNPPIHAWAAWHLYNFEKRRDGQADRVFLEKCVHKLLMNFSCWVNKVDSEGNNVFEGGFLGLDNITVIDRSEPLPAGVKLEQADGTGWMGALCLTLMRMCLELATEDPVYEALATKFAEHYYYVAAAMKNMGGRDYCLWDERDGFFYDVLRHPDGSYHHFRVRSLVGVIPMYAVQRIETDWIKSFPEFSLNLEWFSTNRRELIEGCCYRIEHGGKKAHVLAMFDRDQLRRMLGRILDEDEFLSPFGVRSLSKYHDQNPFRFGTAEVRYEPAEAATAIKGGNSNWRGPIWFPTA
jgi:hypothetical protein